MERGSTPIRGARQAVALLCACAPALAGCLGDGGGNETTRIAGDSATVYSSGPRHGVSALAASAVLAGERQALAEAGGRAGGLRIRLRALPATDDGEHVWDPALVSANAKRAAGDPSTIAYLGEFDYGASAVSLPITNGAGLLQVSPSDGLTSLTQRPPGRPRGGPERYYPPHERSFVRVTPTDLLEVERLIERARAGGAERVAVVFDREIYGRELAAEIVARGRRAGLDPVATEQYRGRPEEIPDIVRGLAEGRPDAVIHAGVAGRGIRGLLAAIGAQLPGVPVYAASGILALQPGAPIPTAPARVEVVAPALPPRRAGYEAMRLVLEAIEVGGRDRRRVIEAALRLGRQVHTDRLVLYRLGDDGRFGLVGRVP